MASAKSGLTSLIVTPGDLKRARRELETYDEAVRQAGIRSTNGATLPASSRTLDEIAAANGTNLSKATDRTALLKQLADLITNAPVMHFSFASEPSGAFLAKLVEWLRSNIHPAILVQVGLQPSIAAGCIVRTSNKQFDFSLRSAFDAQRELLIKSIMETPADQQMAIPPVASEPLASGAVS